MMKVEGKEFFTWTQIAPCKGCGVQGKPFALVSRGIKFRSSLLCLPGQNYPLPRIGA